MATEPQADSQNANEHGKAKLKTKLALLVRAPLFKSIALHTALLISLLVSFNFSAKPLIFVEPQASAPVQQIDIVNATFIDSNVIQQQQREKAQAQADARKRKLEQQRKENLRKKRIAEERKKREEKERAQKAEQERLNKLEREQEKERAIAAQREKEAQEKAQQQKRQEELEKQMSEQLAQEQAARTAANQRRITSEVEKYRAQIYAKVQRNLNNDNAFIGEFCEVRVRLAPDGLVLDARALDGNEALCRMTEAAVIKAGTLPVPRDPEIFAKFRDFPIIYRPEK